MVRHFPDVRASCLSYPSDGGFESTYWSGVAIECGWTTDSVQCSGPPGASAWSAGSVLHGEYALATTNSLCVPDGYMRSGSSADPAGV